MKFYNVAAFMISMSFLSSVVHCAAPEDDRKANDQRIKILVQFGAIKADLFELNFSSKESLTCDDIMCDKNNERIKMAFEKAGFVPEYPDQKMMARVYEQVESEGELRAMPINKKQKITSWLYPLIIKLEKTIELDYTIELDDEKVGGCRGWFSVEETAQELANEVEDALNTRSALQPVREMLRGSYRINMYNEYNRLEEDENGYPRFVASRLLPPETTVGSLNPLALVARIEKEQA